MKCALPLAVSAGVTASANAAVADRTNFMELPSLIWTRAPWPREGASGDPLTNEGAGSSAAARPAGRPPPGGRGRWGGGRGPRGGEGGPPGQGLGALVGASRGG